MTLLFQSKVVGALLVMAHPDRSVSFDARGGFPETHSGESAAPFRVGALLDADI